MSGVGEPAILLFEQRGAVAYIILNRPEKLNAINHELGLALYDAFARCQNDPAVRAIVLAGAGRAFCAGDELGRARTDDELLSQRRSGAVKHYVAGPGRWTSTVRLMRILPQPIVVRIQGYAYGAGFNLALASDFRVMASDAHMATPFIKRGLATGSNLLQQFIGVGRAIEMTLLGEPLDAAQALSFGLVSRVVEPAGLDAAVDALAEQLANGPTGAISLTKHAVYTGWPQDPDGAYWQQGSAMVQGRELEDLHEGMAAFREKRSPNFTGR